MKSVGAVSVATQPTAAVATPPAALPVAVAISPDGKRALVVKSGANRVGLLDIDGQKIHEVRWLPFEGPVELEFDVTAKDARGNLQPRWVVSSGVKVIKSDATRKRGPSPEGDASGRDESGSSEVRHDPKKEIKSRIAQLQGDFATAIRKYLGVQLEELEPQMPLPEKFLTVTPDRVNPVSVAPAAGATVIPLLFCPGFWMMTFAPGAASMVRLFLETLTASR